MLDAIERGIAYPVLFELRNLNDSTLSLDDAIVSFVINNGFPLGESYARKALNKGQLVLLLDGFDEVNFARRKKLVSEIKRLATSSECQIVVSSRPDLTLEGWDLFSRVTMAPLELDEACELVEKIKFDDDDEVKKRFISSLKSGLFETHEYFLSNPLLLSIMLLTYGDAADIPKRFSSFYERAYIALFEKHDAYKGYRRERETDLDISEFSSLFSAFSTVSYDKGSFRFSPSEAAEFVKVAKKLCSSREVSEEGFINDAKQAVCLLVDDGLELAYVHRSFQEYFAAKYIQSADKKVQRALVERYGSKAPAHFAVDNVLKYLHELSPTVVEEFYLIPALSKVFEGNINRKITLQKWRSLILLMFSEIRKIPDENHLLYNLNQSSKAKNLVTLFSFVRDVSQSDYYSKINSDEEHGREFLDFIGDGSFNLKKVSPKSKFWKLYANSGMYYSMTDLDRLRVELLEMMKRVETRQETEEITFLLSPPGRS